MDGAKKILLSITAGKDLSLWEVGEAARAVSEAAHPEANIIFGAMVDEKLVDEVWVTVVATGYGAAPRRAQREAPEPTRSERERPVLREPAGEPRVRRTTSVSDFDVPEFIPRG
jgi:cell division protein FtsZ